MDKHDIAHVLEEIAVLLELQGANPFRIRAYYNAARTIENIDEEIELVVLEERLITLPGIGKDLAEKITTLVATGKLPYYEELRSSMPASLLDLLHVPGLGGKKIKVLYEKLGIETIDDLADACSKGRIAELKGFGARSQENFMRGIAKMEAFGIRLIWWEAMKIAASMVERMAKISGVKRVAIAGSLRRKLETVGDLDFVASTDNPEELIHWFSTHQAVSQVVAKGPTKTTVRLKQGIQADLRLVTEEEFAFSAVTSQVPKNITLRYANLPIAKA